MEAKLDESERLIVAFLRERALKSKRDAALNDGNKHGRRLLGEASARKADADAIERGEHRKKKE